MSSLETMYSDIPYWLYEGERRYRGLAVEPKRTRSYYFQKKDKAAEEFAETRNKLDIAITAARNRMYKEFTAIEAECEANTGHVLDHCNCKLCGAMK